MDFIDVRVRFTKTGNLKFISHLDLNRFMQRAIKRAGLPLWHTEGFNPHPYVTLALPLSLGQESLCEVMDFRLIRPMPAGEILNALQAVFPKEMQVLKVSDLKMKTKAIAYAAYTIVLHGQADRKSEVEASLFSPDLQAEKRTKKGDILTLNLADHMKELQVVAKGKDLSIHLCLPAGSEWNVNPALVVEALEAHLQTELPHSIVRTDILTSDFTPFC